MTPESSTTREADQDGAQAIVIGASAGAIEALTKILPALPSEFSLPILVVVHLPPDKDSMLPKIFGAKCRMAVREAEDKETIQAGTIYFAPSNYHLLVETGGILSLSSDEPELYSRPAINVLFESAADAYGSGLVAVVLTGANNDGADGLRLVRQAGGIAVVQDPETAEACTMPEAALAACPGAQVLTLEKIAVFLSQLAKPILI